MSCIPAAGISFVPSYNTWSMYVFEWLVTAKQQDCSAKLQEGSKDGGLWLYSICVCLGVHVCVGMCVLKEQLQKLIADLCWQDSGRRCEGYACALYDNKRKGDECGFLPFVYVDKIAGFLCLLCHSCHSSANCVEVLGGSLLEGDSFWAETNTTPAINTVSLCQLIL